MLEGAKRDVGRKADLEWFQSFLPLYKKGNVVIQTVAEVAAWCGASCHAKRADFSHWEDKEAAREWQESYSALVQEWWEDSKKKRQEWTEDPLAMSESHVAKVLEWQERYIAKDQEWWEGFTVKGKMLLAFQLVHWDEYGEERERMLIVSNGAAKDLSSVLKLLRRMPQPKSLEMRKIKKGFEGAVKEYIGCFKRGVKFLKNPVIPRRYRLNPKMLLYIDWVGAAERASDKMQQCDEAVSAFLG